MATNQSIKELADSINSRSAQLAVARAMVFMGANPDWDSETIEHVAGYIGDAAPTGIPSFMDNVDDDDAIDYWQSFAQ